MNYSDLIQMAILYFIKRKSYENMRSELSQRIDYINHVLEERELTRKQILNYLTCKNFNVSRIDLEQSDEADNQDIPAKRTGS